VIHSALPRVLSVLLTAIRLAGFGYADNSTGSQAGHDHVSKYPYGAGFSSDAHLRILSGLVGRMSYVAFYRRSHHIDTLSGSNVKMWETAAFQGITSRQTKEAAGESVMASAAGVARLNKNDKSGPMSAQPWKSFCTQ
jgi:hypothetical protein